MANEASRAIRRLVGVYNADGTAIGELTYFVAARLGRAHCELCDITHGLVRAKPEWRACRTQLPVAFETFHRDDQPDALRGCYDEPPIVAAETDLGFAILLRPADLAACHGSVAELIDAVRRAAAAADLTWPG